MIISILVFIFILAPLCLLIHEGGHIVFARLFRANQTDLYIGTGPTLSLQKGSFQIHVGLFYMVGAAIAYEKTAGFTTIQRVLISFGGPFFNLVFAIVGWWMNQYINQMWLLYFIYFNSWLTFFNIIPLKVREKQSDGYIIIRELLSRNDHE